MNGRLLYPIALFIGIFFAGSISAWGCPNGQYQRCTLGTCVCLPEVGAGRGAGGGGGVVRQPGAQPRKQGEKLPTYPSPPIILSPSPGGAVAPIGELNSQPKPSVTNTSIPTRTFMGPHDYPPVLFAAYGIVAFPQTATADSKPRFVKACEAYLATLPLSSSVGRPMSAQMVTIWPIDRPDTALYLSSSSAPSNVCDIAVAHYDLTTALYAIHEATRVGGTALTGDGPYLLAWAPSSEKGKPDALVLVADLSNAMNSEQFTDYFRDWRTSIEQNPGLWNKGWSREGIRLAIRDWADKWGTTILSAVGVKN
jgi:hypothetical protein